MDQLKPRSFDRLYLQYLPDDEAADRLIAIRDLLGESGMTGRPVSRRKLHMTAIHVGVLPDVFAQLHEHNGDLSADRFDEAIDHLTDTLDKVEPVELRMQPTSLLALGHYGTTMTLGFERSADFMTVFDTGLVAMRQFLRRCGVSHHPYDLPPRQRAIQFFARLPQPHVTILDGATPPRLLRLPPDMVSEPMRFRRAPVTEP